MFLRLAGQSCGQAGPDPPGGSLHRGRGWGGEWGKEVGSSGQELISSNLEDKREEAAKVAQRFWIQWWGWLLVAFQTKAEVTVSEMFGRKRTSIQTLLPSELLRHIELLLFGRSGRWSSDFRTDWVTLARWRVEATGLSARPLATFTRAFSVELC